MTFQAALIDIDYAKHQYQVTITVREEKKIFKDFTVKDMKTIHNNIIISCGTNSFHILYIVRIVVDQSVRPVCFLSSRIRHYLSGIRIFHHLSENSRKTLNFYCVCDSL
jgi:hypothetical protein